MDSYPKTKATSIPTDDNAILRAAQERIERKRADLGIKTKSKSICTSALGLGVSEVLYVKEVHEVNKESPCGDFSPSAASKAEIQNAKDKDSTTASLTASVEAGLFTKGSEPTARGLFQAGRYGDIRAGDFIQLAWEASAGKSWQEDGCSETWEFCRYLLAHPEFNSLTRGQLVKKLRRLTKLEDCDLQTIVTEMGRVRFAKGKGPLDWAFTQATQKPISDPEGLGFEDYDHFLSTAGWLQVWCGEDPIFVPVEVWAPLFGVTHQTISNWRTLAKRQGVLTETAPYIAQKRATQFRFDVDRYPVLKTELEKRRNSHGH
jgi:hypothetical protein